MIFVHQVSCQKKYPEHKLSNNSENYGGKDCQVSVFMDEFPIPILVGVDGWGQGHEN